MIDSSPSGRYFLNSINWLTVERESVWDAIRFAKASYCSAFQGPNLSQLCDFAYREQTMIALAVKIKHIVTLKNGSLKFRRLLSADILQATGRRFFEVSMRRRHCDCTEQGVSSLLWFY